MSQRFLAKLTSLRWLHDGQWSISKDAILGIIFVEKGSTLLAILLIQNISGLLFVRNILHTVSHTLHINHSYEVSISKAWPAHQWQKSNKPCDNFHAFIMICETDHSYSTLLRRGTHIIIGITCTVSYYRSGPNLFTISTCTFLLIPLSFLFLSLWTPRGCFEFMKIDSRSLWADAPSWQQEALH